MIFILKAEVGYFNTNVNEVFNSFYIFLVLEKKLIPTLQLLQRRSKLNPLLLKGVGLKTQNMTKLPVLQVTP